MLLERSGKEAACLGDPGSPTVLRHSGQECIDYPAGLPASNPEMEISGTRRSLCARDVESAERDFFDPRLLIPSTAGALWVREGH